MTLASKHRPALLRWFYDAPIGRKQTFAMIICELVPLLGLGIGSTVVLTNSLRTQLLAQAKSEVAVTETNYNIKVNQMGFGSRGQSDNIQIVNAVKIHQQQQPLAADLQSQVKQTLQNEVKARKIEYATLVGKDLKIIANANANRSGETITSPALVEIIKQSLQEVRQIKASEGVKADELAKENPPLPARWNKQDALIRYVVTPIKNPDNQEAIGVLIFGDVVNGKLPIVEGTLKSFAGGYSAIYLRRAAGEFSLATALNQPQGVDFKQAQPDIALPNTTLLETAANAKGEAVTQRLTIGDQAYTIAAQAMPNRVLETPEGSVPVYTQPTAILVRGTPENALNSLLSTSFQQEIIVLLLSLVVIATWSAIFRRAILNPIQHLEKATQTFAQGDRLVRADVFSQDEVGQLAIAFNRMAESINLSETALADEAARQELQAKEARGLTDITARMRRSLNATTIFQTAAHESREFLRVDRVLVYRFEDDLMNGIVIAEAIVPGYTKSIQKKIQNPLGFDRIDYYSNQTTWSVQNSTQDPLTENHQAVLDQLDARAEIAVPLKQHDRVIGLLCAHQARPRQWQVWETDFLAQLAIQIGYALDQADLMQERQDSLQTSEALKESLQQQILALLAEVEGATRGDLTVRADVSARDMGTVADFFNAIVESLRQIVQKVKHSTLQVNSLLGANEGDMQQLADQALKQASETTHILDSIEQMTVSIQAVADSAHQAAIVARNASTTAETGELEMDATVQIILNLRTTIEQTAKKVKQLGEASQQISRVVSLINEIAVQTDLLAINASIEASRAGDYGRGFAIVASEVGELAARSGAATREIATLVETIQQETRAVVEAMGQGTHQVVEGAHSVKNAKQSLMHMVHVSRQIDALVQSISQATVSQAQTSRSVTDLIKDVTQVSARTSESSRRVSGALRQTVEVAQELQESVEMFKITP